MKKLLFNVLLIVLFGASVVYAGGVTDNNNGSVGDVLIHSGVNHGANSVGTWADSSNFKGDKGDKGSAGAKGLDGKEGKRGKKGDTGKGLKDRYELQLEGVVKETRKTATSVYYIRDFNNANNTFGLKFKYYFGKSYSEQVNEDLQNQIDELKKLLDVKKEVDYVERDSLKVKHLGNQTYFYVYER